MNLITVVGKANFSSRDQSKHYFVLHCLSSKDTVEGYAVDTKFVSQEIFNKVSVNSRYEVIYGCYDNGRAFVSDLKEVVKQ